MDSKVTILKVPSYNMEEVEQAVEKLFANVECTNKINSDTKILIKPNLLAKHVPEHAVTTHPEVVRATIRACKRRGALAEHIIVADSAGGLYNPGQMKSLYKVSGLAAVCDAEGVEAYSRCESTEVKTKNGKVVTEFEILNPVLEADFIINLPKLKSHVMTGMTAACKNMFGVIPGLKKSEWHMRFPDKERFGDMLIDLLETITPDMAILDGVLAMEGDGPAGGEPRTVGILMASEDMLNLDLAIAHLMGLEPMRVPYLKAGYQRSLCDSKIDKSHMVGDMEMFQPILDWKLPESYQGNQDGDTYFAAVLPKFLQPITRKIEEKVAPRPVITKKLCIGCGKCAEICSQDTIVIKDKKARIVQKGCIRCFCCHEMCPVKAIEVKKLKLFGL